jgi:hypothetical protein
MVRAAPALAVGLTVWIQGTSCTANAALQQQQQRHHHPIHQSSSTARTGAAATSTRMLQRSSSSPSLTTCLNLASSRPDDEQPQPSLVWNSYDTTKPPTTTIIALPIVRTAKIISLSNVSDPANAPLHDAGNLPEGAELLQVGAVVADFDIPALQQAGVNTIFVSHPAAREPLAQLLQLLPPRTIQWIHTRSAGIDFITSTPLLQAIAATADSAKTEHGGGGNIIVMTNAKGQFSSTLAEYAMAACSFFAKDFARLRRNQRDKTWDRYVYRACAR